MAKKSVTGGSWIAEAMAKPGAKGGLHRSLGIAEGKKIPEKRLEAATHSKNTKVKRQAIMAENMKKARKK